MRGDLAVKLKSMVSRTTECEMEKEYRIKLCSRDQSEYGNCERCGKRCVPHYKQQWRRKGVKNTGWTNCGYGHTECLRNGSWENAAVVDG
jgi:hypothetical protein